jgi:hypothetical protein
VLLGEIAERVYTGCYHSLAGGSQVTGWITGLPGRLDPADGERSRAIRAAALNLTPQSATSPDSPE